MQPLFQNGGGPILRFLLLAVLSIILMVADHRDQYVDQVRTILFTAISPLQYTAALPARSAEWTYAQFATNRALHERVDRLQRENLQLSARQQKFETLLAENDRLRELLDASAKRDERVLVAELLAVDLDPFRQQVIVNRGSRAGIYRGQPVIDAGGVMGQVINTGPFTATVLLLSDPDHALSVQINRNGLRTIAAGRGDPERLELLYIPNSADVRVDDLVATSGLDGRFPANYPVGRVTEVNRRPGQAFAEVAVRPLANLDRSREVLMVWPDQGQEEARRAVHEHPDFEVEVMPDGTAGDGSTIVTPESTAPTPPADDATVIPEGEADDLPGEGGGEAP